MKSITKALGKKPPKYSHDIQAGFDNTEDITAHYRTALKEAAQEIEAIREYYPKSILAREGWLPRLAKKLRISAGD
jgi:hypothetical protein